MSGRIELSWLDYPPAELEGGAITVGNFDGVHRGHRALIVAAAERARPVIAMTFDPPPQRILANGDLSQAPLTTWSERIRLLRDAGADAVVVLRTTPELLALSAEAFFEEIIFRRFCARAMIEGFNFRFGRSRLGTNDTLRQLCTQFGVQFQIVEPILADGEPISSSRIRQGLMQGDVRAVSNWLGHVYHIDGVIVEGAKRGRTLGFPTANLAEVETLIPGEGVYAVRVQRADGSWLGGAANIGPNPTFAEAERKIEVHMLDFSGNLYGERLRVAFVERLRPTQPFNGVAALIEQLQRDITQTRKILAKDERS